MDFVGSDIVWYDEEFEYYLWFVEWGIVLVVITEDGEKFRRIGEV